MNAKLVLFAAVLTGCVLDVVELKDLFKVNRLELLPWNEAIQRLNRESVSAEVIARTLARTADKTGLVEGEFSFKDLLALSSWEYSDCTSKEMQRRTETCSKLTGSLQNYCERCVERVKELCSKSIISVLVNSVDLTPVHSLKVFVDAYYERNDLDGYPLELGIEDFLSLKPKTTRDYYKAECTKLMKAWDEEVPLFQPNRALAAKELRDQDYYLSGAVKTCELVVRAVDWKE